MLEQRHIFFALKSGGFHSIELGFSPDQRAPHLVSFAPVRLQLGETGKSFRFFQTPGRGSKIGSGYPVRRVKTIVDRVCKGQARLNRTF